MKSGRLPAFLLVFAFWAAIYLPGLGYLEIQGEEGTRILPAVAMLRGESSWVTPTFGGENYFNKPPGINWLVAASFAITGRQDEFSARLPSGILLLSFVSMLMWMPLGKVGGGGKEGNPEKSFTVPIGTSSPFLDPQARLAIAVVFLSMAGLMEKGRLIEIEAPYVAFGGMALLWWLNGFVGQRPSAYRWVLPCVLLAFGALTKGPFLAVPFYAGVVCVLIYHRRLKDLLSVGHLVGIAIILAMCLGWVGLLFRENGVDAVLKQWTIQLHPRLSPKSFDFVCWAKMVLLSLANMMPWLLFAPVLWIRRFYAKLPQDQLRLFRALRLGMVLGFAGLCVGIPHLEPRYTLPALPLAAILIGWVISRQTQPTVGNRIWKCILLIVLALMVPVALVGAMVPRWPTLANLLEMPRAAGLTTSPWQILAVAWFAILAAGTILFRQRLQGGLALTILTGVVCWLVLAQYLVWVTPYREKYSTRLRPVAKEVNGLVGGQTLYIYNPARFAVSPFVSALFYVHTPVEYLKSADQIDARVRYLLVNPTDLSGEVGQAIAPRHPEQRFLAGRLPDYGRDQDSLQRGNSVRLLGGYDLLELKPASKPSDG